MVHPLAVLLDEAAHDRFPPADGRVHALPSLPGGIDALVGFTGTFRVTGTLTQAEVDARVPNGELAIPMSPEFVSWAAARLGAKALTQDIVLVATAPGAQAAVPATVELVEVAESDHSRVAEASRHRRGLRVYETMDRAGVVVLGRGITGRWEIAYEADDHARNRGLGRALATAGLGLLPEGTPVWAQVAPGNAASVRAMLGAGFRPVGAEILFVRDPK